MGDETTVKPIKPITLREVMQHSAQFDYVEVSGLFKLKILPWVAVVLEECEPLVKRLIEEFKKAAEKDKDRKVQEIILEIASKKEYLEDIYHIVYVTMERGNKEIIVTIDGEEHKMGFFTIDEMKQEIPLETILDIIRVIWTQNFSKNLSRESDLQKIKQEMKKEILETISPEIMEVAKEVAQEIQNQEPVSA